MNVQINYKNIRFTKNPTNYVLFTDENYNITGLKKYFSNNEFSIVSDLLKSKELKKNIIFLDISSKKTIVLISLKKEIQSSDIETLGAKFFNILKDLRTHFLNTDPTECHQH